MNSDLDEREFELVNIIGARLANNQRDLSRRMDLSLGLVNMLIRRLIAKGYIRINQLNKRKVEYLLTPQGFSEKMRKSVQYTLKTIRSIGMIKEQLKEFLRQHIQPNDRVFQIVGDSDFAQLVEVILKEMISGPCQIRHVPQIPSQPFEGKVLVCREIDKEKYRSENIINVVEGLTPHYFFQEMVKKQ